jgi:hypothetical protein
VPLGGAWHYTCGTLVKELNIVKLSWNLCSQPLESVKNALSIQNFIFLVSLTSAPGALVSMTFKIIGKPKKARYI